jgi:hypothetical protein
MTTLEKLKEWIIKNEFVAGFWNIPKIDYKCLLQEIDRLQSEDVCKWKDFNNFDYKLSFFRYFNYLSVFIKRFYVILYILCNDFD